MKMKMKEMNGAKLWTRAKNIIPGGNMLLSKRAEMFLPREWPTYFTKTNGINVWDLRGKKYIDMSIMGVGTNTLGYNNREVDKSVKNTISKGNLSTLNCPEEVYLAEKLVDMHKWSNMARFARTGGEANAIAIRIARAATGRDAVAICGYHGWHDWYLATNLERENGLADHLLSGLSTNGVPKNLKGSVYPFKYNNIEEIKAITDRVELAAIKMEVHRNVPPKQEFLNEVRELATKKGIALIFDECTSGFRQTFGGIHKMYEVEPDMAVFGKALGNGYAITAVIGKESIMTAAQSSFISSTFWTERIGPTAALKTLQIMEKIQSWEKITKNGMYLRENWKMLAKTNELEIEVSGLPAISAMRIKSIHSNIYKTYITQEMLKKGYLASTVVYLSILHNKKVIDRYTEELDSIFKVISKCERGEIDPKSILLTEEAHTGFQRLN